MGYNSLMPHVAFVPFTGLRVAEQEMLSLGMTLPGFRQRADAIGQLPSLGLLTLAGMLPPEWTCSYHPSGDSPSPVGKNDPQSGLLQEVVVTKPDLVAVSALTASIDEAYSFCDSLRGMGIKTVLGGLHATVMPSDAQTHTDAVCVGDGESSWLTILHDCVHDQLKQIYRPESVFSLSESPQPRFELLNQRSIPRWTVQTQRGCPWACEFCGASRLLGPVRFKPVDAIDRELEAIKSQDRTPWIELADDNTFANRVDWQDMLSCLSSHKVRFFTESDWRIGENSKLVGALAESGCVQVLVGIESLAFRYPGMGKKSGEMARMMDAIQSIQSAGIVVNGCFIVGADGETHESMDRMIRFIADSTLAEVQVTLQTPFPGTALFQRLQKQGRLLARPWSHYSLFDVVFQPDKLEVCELEAGFRRILQEVFSEGEATRRSQLRRQIWKLHPRLAR
jgi:radical SAM superfamily enzyme YgiQ (UPF0313 family)